MLHGSGVARFARVALISAVVGCSPGDPDLAALQREPAAAIRLSDATDLGHFSGEKASTLEGPQPAFDAHVFGAQRSAEEVRAFYDQALVRSGWQADRLAASLSTTELQAWGWCKGAMKFRIGIEDQPRAFRPEFYRGQSFQTVFDARIVGRDPAIGCPTRVSP